MTQDQERIEKFVKANMQEQVDSEMKRANDLAKLVMDFNNDQNGKELANVQTSQGFQEVYDYFGSEKVRFRLDRKKDQVSASYDARTQLFQRLYYTRDLLLDDERQLRNSYFLAEKNYTMLRQAGQAGLLLAYFPLTYRLAAVVRPATLVLWTGAYYYGAYKNGLEPAALWQFQNALNSSARGIATRYNL